MMKILNWISDCNSVYSLWKFAGNEFMLTENGVANTHTHTKLMIFSSILKPTFKFLYHNRKHGCLFFTVHRTVFSQYIKLCKTICHNLSQHCTVPFLCPIFSPESANACYSTTHRWRTKNYYNSSLKRKE